MTMVDQVFPPPSFPANKKHLKSLDEYKQLHQQSIQDPQTFWAKMATQHLDWMRPFTHTMHGSFEQGSVAWFLNGQLNAAYNCIDRHPADKVALLWDSDEGHHLSYTYGQLLAEVSRVAYVLKRFGVRKGDCVGIYMPMVPEAAFAMLACARIGAIHSVVFAGFSADALRDRLNDAQCKVLLTADQGKRGGKAIHLKKIADDALKQCPSVKKTLVFQRTGEDIPWDAERDVWWHEAVASERPYIPCEPMDSEDPLFMLYTSGSTGKPKGVLHSTAGYLLGALMTTKYVFDLHDGDIHGCMADIGWITGHSYIVYGPLAAGTTTVMFESIPTYPTPSRYWELVEKFKITAFYTAPTAIRALRRLGAEHVQKNDLSSLRVIGSVGEPINPEAWLWYHEHVGQKRCAVVDTYWQTETGSIVITPMPTVTPTKPGSATLPFFGIDPVLLDATTGQEQVGNGVEGVLAIRKPFPSIARTVYGDHERYLNTYLKPYPGYYFTGDGAFRDKDGYIWIQGRVDDVINVAGHRLSTAEIESALVLHPTCAEAAVVGVPDDVTGQAILCFCVLKSLAMDDKTAATTLRNQVREHIGPFATPKRVVIVPDLPKTRSGKIMRRILRKCAAGDVTLEDIEADDAQERIANKLGDLSTLADPSVVKTLISRLV